MQKSNPLAEADGIDDDAPGVCAPVCALRPEGSAPPRSSTPGVRRTPGHLLFLRELRDGQRYSLEPLQHNAVFGNASGIRRGLQCLAPATFRFVSFRGRQKVASARPKALLSGRCTHLCKDSKHFVERHSPVQEFWPRPGYAHDHNIEPHEAYRAMTGSTRACTSCYKKRSSGDRHFAPTYWP